MREALLNLRAEGLLVQHPRRGFMVLEVTARDIADVANVQAFIGGELAARAAENITDEQLAALRAIQDDLEQAYEQDDLERTVRLNHEFHRTINVAADSPKLTQFMSGITRYAPESVFPTVSGWPKQSIRDHRAVIAAFERRDANRARIAMAEHFTVGVAPLTDHLIERGVITEGESDGESQAERCGRFVRRDLNARRAAPRGDVEERQDPGPGILGFRLRIGQPRNAFDELNARGVPSRS